MEKRRLVIGQREIDVEIYRPSRAAPCPGILLLHEACGLRDWYREDAADLAARGYLVYVPDLFTGGALRYCIRVLIQEAERKNRSTSESNHEIHALLDALNSDSQCNGRLGMLGACLTGGFVLQMAQRADMIAPVVYHHSLGIEGAGVPKEESLEGVRRLQGHWSSLIDPFCPAKRRARLIDALGDRLEAYTYPMPHGFRSRSRRLSASQVVWQRTVDFFDTHLRQT